MKHWHVNGRDLRGCRISTFVTAADEAGARVAALACPGFAKVEEVREDRERCDRCGWPIDTNGGCTRGNCSMRPLPAPITERVEARGHELVIRLDERNAVLAWLRGMDPHAVMSPSVTADRIERCEHHR